VIVVNRRNYWADSVVPNLRFGESVPSAQEAAVLGGVMSSNSAPTTECASRRG
jgi:hypothetical protein